MIPLNARLLRTHCTILRNMPHEQGGKLEQRKRNHAERWREVEGSSNSWVLGKTVDRSSKCR
jgi:hypothetical protein